MRRGARRLLAVVPIVLGLAAPSQSVASESLLSQLKRGGEPAEYVKVSVVGFSQLTLRAEGVPNYHFAHSDWGDARLIAADGRVTYLSDLKPIRVHQPYGKLQRDRSHRGGPITIGGRRFERGLGTHAFSEISYALEGKYAWFEVWLGVDATAGSNGQVRFTITERPAGRADHADPAALRRAITDLIETFGPRYPQGPEFLARLDAWETGDQALVQLRREALLANPLLDFDRLLLVRRRPKGGNADRAFGWSIGFPRSSAGNVGIPRRAWDNEIAVLSPVTPEGKLTTLYRPEDNKFVGDVDLHFDAGKLAFSMRDDRGLFQVFEVNADGTGLRQRTPGDQPDVDSYDPCYLPDGGLVFASSACFQGVPCNKSSVEVLYRIDADRGNLRQLCFEQDHDFNPVMLPSGRVLYLRWEYSDLPHATSRMLFSMNPDGTGQAAYYGSGSYWPNAIFAPRPIPSRSGQVVGIVAGHHGSHREGELVLFDTNRGRHEATGVVQRIPGFGQKVEPVVADELTAASWPKFAHPFPLSEKYFLVTCKLDSQAPWSIYLVDVFDNLLPLFELPGHALLEPIPLRPVPAAPAIPTKVDPTEDHATVYLADVYRGDGLRGVPRGTVKRLRLVTYHFAYRGMGGLLGSVGVDGPWDIKRVLGTVPVRPDGSAVFRVPANTPIAVQPLDAQGKALQLMRSWFVGMPGEVLSCVGCHERQSTTPPVDPLAPPFEPSPITPWHAAPQNFSYKREVQPVVDRYCTGCHDGRSVDQGGALPDLRGTERTADYTSHIAGNSGGAGGRTFSRGYYEMTRYVRRPGIESDAHLLPPLEFHADTTQLVQMLAKGHHGVQLAAAAWERLITWIDLNAPYHGTWTEIGWDPGTQRRRRSELRRLYAGVDEDPESLAEVPAEQVEPLVPPPIVETLSRPVECEGWPFDAAEAARRQAAAGAETRRTVDLGDGLRFEMVLIPAGEFVMGDHRGELDERPRARVRVEQPFWMATCEVTNRLYARFDPTHDSRFESKNGYQFGVEGFPLDGPEQPVVRVSWRQATAFCRWLAAEMGRPFALPTEANWEYAARAGTDTPLCYGDLGSDFSRQANMADAKLGDFATDPYTVFKPLPTLTPYDDWIPRDGRFNDGELVTAGVGKYEPNAWGLHDMHGNVAEWTRTAYRPYPYDPRDGRNTPTPQGKKVVRGGSWRDRPARCRSAFRLAYPAWQGVYNVGFRVVCPVEE